MAQEIIVCNTTPLIALAWLKQLDLLPILFGTVYIPQAVFDELNYNPEKIGVIELSQVEWLRIVTVSNKLAVELLSSELDAGESEAIVLAHEMKARLLLIDERRGRRRVTEGGLVVTGTLGILIEARKRGIIGPLRPILDDLQELPFRMSRNLYEQTLNLVGEEY